MTEPTPTDTARPSPTETPLRKPRTRGREKRELMCVLTVDDIRDRGAEMARCELDAKELEAELESLKLRARSLKARIDDLGEDCIRLARAIDTGEEPRLIDCEWVEATEQHAWRLMRLDTQVEIDKQAMTPAELQLGLELAGEADATDGGGGDGDDAEPAEPAPKRKRKTAKPNGKRHKH
jgi:hypothetical protein